MLHYEAIKVHFVKKKEVVRDFGESVDQLAWAPGRDRDFLGIILKKYARAKIAINLLNSLGVLPHVSTRRIALRWG